MPRTPDLPCSSCGTLMWRGPGSRLDGSAMCQPCRRNARTHGTVVMYKKAKCRCGECRAANARDIAEYVAKRKVEGRPIPKRRYPESDRHYSMTKAERVSIYERDGFLCQLCNEPLDMTAHFNEALAPTLDHIVPQSVTIDHSPNNLRAAHRICNAKRGNRVDDVAA